MHLRALSPTAQACKGSLLSGVASWQSRLRPFLTSCAAKDLRSSSNSMEGKQAARGAFIVFEGIDRCGKSTQCAKLMEYLQQKGVSAELLRFPDRTAITGQTINDYLASKQDLGDEAIHLLFSANRWERRQALLDKLHAGVTLVVDRYAFSGVAYSAAKANPHMTLEWCKAPDAGLPAPDKVLFMQVDPRVSASRAGYGEERYEKLSLQIKVAAVFDQLKTASWASFDATQTVEQVAAQVASEVDQVLETLAARNPPVATLWDAGPSAVEAAGTPHDDVSCAKDVHVKASRVQPASPKPSQTDQQQAAERPTGLAQE